MPAMRGWTASIAAELSSRRPGVRLGTHAPGRTFDLLTDPLTAGPHAPVRTCGTLRGLLGGLGGIRIRADALLFPRAAPRRSRRRGLGERREFLWHDAWGGRGKRLGHRVQDHSGRHGEHSVHLWSGRWVPTG